MLRYSRLRWFLMEKLPWFIAWKIPRKVALFCFIRVYATLGTVSYDYKNAYDNWSKGIGK